MSKYYHFWFKMTIFYHFWFYLYFFKHLSNLIYMDYSNKYVPKTLTKKDKAKQKKQLDKSVADYKKGKFTGRKKLASFQSKTSGFVKEVKEKLGVPMNINKIADKLTRTDKRKKEVKTGLEEIMLKGKGAYYSSGSRPNQTAFSWGLGRIASVLTGGKSRKIDKKIVDKYKIPEI